jgi:hypothetical protein
MIIKCGCSSGSSSSIGLLHLAAHVALRSPLGSQFSRSIYHHRFTHRLNKQIKRKKLTMQNEKNN